MKLKYNQNKIAQICRKNDIKSLALFGSYARNEATKASDIDLLVEYAKPKSYFTYFDTVYDFENYFKKSIDLVTKRSLNPHMREGVMEDLIDLYEEKARRSA